MCLNVLCWVPKCKQKILKTVMISQNFIYRPVCSKVLSNYKTTQSLDSKWPESIFKSIIITMHTLDDGHWSTSPHSHLSHAEELDVQSISTTNMQNLLLWLIKLAFVLLNILHFPPDLVGKSVFTPVIPWLSDWQIGRSV